MQAVILAAGKSTRTYPLTLTRPKPLLKAANKTILEHNLEQLEGLVEEVIIVIGHKGEMIKDFMKGKFKSLKIRYVEQKKQLGTGDALLKAKKYIKNRFVVLAGDDFYSREDIKQCLNEKYCVLGCKVKDYSNFGILRTKGKFLEMIIEKPERFISNIANTSLYVLDNGIFDVKIKKSQRNEYEAVDLINHLKNKVVVKVVKDYWIPIGFPWSLLEANIFFLNKKKRSEIKGVVEKGVTIKGNVILGKKSIIKSGSYIEGPVMIGENCIIGPNAYLRPATAIGDNCKIRAEVVDSIIMKNTTAKHFSYIGHSVIGENCNIAAGTVTADYRHDCKEHITIIGGKKINSGRKKLGCFIGDNARTGINTSIYPGRSIWPGKTTLPGEIVTEDIK